MSKSEIERFSADLNEDQGLFDEVAGKAGDLAAVVALAQARGYSFTLDEVNEHNASRSHTISDEQLDEVAAGAKTSSILVNPIAIPKVIVAG